MKSIYQLDKKELPSIFSFYTSGRILSLVTKPLILFLLINLSSNESAALFAQILTISISLSLLLGVEIHMEFYNSRFNNKPIAKKIVKSEIIYFRDLIALNSITSLISFLIFFVLSENYLTSALFALFMFSEVLYNEQSRYLIFCTKFNSWTRLALSKSIVQILSVLLVLYFEKLYVNEIFMLSTIIFTLIYFMIFQNFRGLKKLYFSYYSDVNLFSLSRVLGIYKTRIYYLLASFTSKHTLLLDRYLVMFIKPSFFSTYVLFCNLVSAMPTLVDIFFLTKNRYRYVEEKLSIEEIIKDKVYKFSLASGFVISLLAIVITSFVLSLEDFLPNELILYGILLCFVYLLFSACMPLYELFFWHKGSKERFFLELLSTVLVLTSGFCVYALSGEFLWAFLCLLSLIMIFRFYLLYKFLY